MDFKNDQELQSHICSKNQTKNNPMKVFFINLADSPDYDDENEMPYELVSVPRKIPINWQNNTENTKDVRPKGGSTILDLESDIPIIIDDGNKFVNSKPRSTDLIYKTLKKNLLNKPVNIGSGQNIDINLSNNPEIYINPNIIIIDDDSTNNLEIVSRNENDIARIDNTSVLRNNNIIELTDELINSDKVEDSRLINLSPTSVTIGEEISEVLINVPPQIDYDELSKVLETVSTDLNTMFRTDEIKNNNLDIPPINSKKNNCITGVDVDNDVPKIYGSGDIKLLANKKVNETNTLEMRNLQELNGLPYMDIDDVNPSIYLENSVEIEELDIMKDTEINMKDIDPEIVLDNGRDVEDSNATLENSFVSNVLENYVEVLDSKFKRSFGNAKDVVDLVNLENNMDDANPSAQIDKVLGDVDPEAILVSNDFDPKALENCLDVLDPNVIEDSVRVIDPQYNSDVDFNMLHPKTVKGISSSVELDDLNIISGTALDAVNPKVVKNNINIVDSNNVEIEYFTKDSEGNMLVVDSKIILKKDIQLELLSFLNDESILSINSNQKIKTKPQQKNEIIIVEKLSTRENNVSAQNLNILTDYDVTTAKKNKVTKSKFNRPKTKTPNVIKTSTANEEKQINQNAQTREGEQSILTDSMLDIITCNPHASTNEAEHIMEIVSNLEESIATDLHCRNVSANTFDADYNNIDDDDDTVKRISSEELVKVSMPPGGRSRFRKSRTKKTQTDLKFQCELCDIKFDVKYILDRHHRIVHLGNKKKAKLDNDSGIPFSKNYHHKCDYCRMFFHTTSGLREHTKKRHAEEMFLMEANKPVEYDVCQKKIIKSFIGDHKAKAHTPLVVVLDHRHRETISVNSTVGLSMPEL